MKRHHAFGMACALLISAHAAVAGDGGFGRAVEARYRAVEAAIAARDAQAWFDALYSRNAVVVGEGSKEAMRGREVLMPVIEGIVRETRSCTINSDGAPRMAAGLGYSFAVYACKPLNAEAPEYQVRALYVWRREAVGWRVVAEMYTLGSM